MRFKGLNLNLLVALLALLEERSVSRAANRVYLSQSAMSGVLSRLREHYNDPLLMPSGRGLALSPFAESLIEPLRTVIDEIETVVRATAGFDPGTSQRRFTLVTSDYMIQTLLPFAMALICERAPGVSLEVAMPAGNMDANLNRGDIDLIITPFSFISASSNSELFCEEDMVAVVSANNQLVGADLDLETFRSLRRVVTRFPSSSDRLFDNQRLSFAEYNLRLAHCDAPVAAVVPTFSASFAALVGTNNVVIVHRRLAQAAARWGTFRVFELPIEMPTLNEFAYYHPLRSQDAGLQWFLSTLREALALSDKAPIANSDVSAS